MFIGLDIGGTKILGALFDENGVSKKKEKRKTKASEGLEVVQKEIFKTIDNLLAGIKIKEIEAIGIGIPGLVDREGTITFSPNLPFRNYELAKILEKRYKVPVFIGNDVNVATVGEWMFGSGKGKKNVLGVFVGTGIGGGIIIENELYIGKNGAAGEIGHINLDPNGPFCGCGSRGCLESLASKTAIQKEIETRIYRGEESLILKSLKENGILKSGPLRDAYLKKDVVVVEAVSKAAENLGRGLASLANIFNPEVIVLGGGVMVELGKELLPIVTREFDRFAMIDIAKNTEIKMAKFGDDAGIIGALALAKEEMARKPKSKLGE